MIFNLVRPLNRVIVRAGGIAAVVVLAACAEGDKPETTETPPATTPPAATVATGASIGLTNCPTPSEGKVHFKIADSTLAVPGNIVLDAIPAGMQPPITKDRVVAELKTQTGQGKGCPGTPLDAGLLMVQDKLNHPLLDGSVGLLALPPGGITERFAAETRRLQQNPSKSCNPIGEDLIGCVGTEKRGDISTNVMYVITTDKTQNMASGGPLAARCTLEGDKVAGCNLVDRLEGGLAMDASLRSGTYSTEALRGALDAATTHINAMRI